jgi:hypothetical protein
MGNCALTSAFSPPPRCSRRRGSRAARQKEKHDRKAPWLPDDIIIVEILARADVVTIVRCAAASKSMRRQITDPAFLKCYHADADIVPSVLLGIFQKNDGHAPYRFISTSPSTKFTLRLTPPPSADEADGFFDSCVPVTSRAGLVLLRGVDDRNLTKLCVYNPITGRKYFVPPAEIYDYSHVLLPGDEDDNTGRSFRLLIMDKACRTQIFSSSAPLWNQTRVPPGPGALPSYHRVQPAAVVLRGVAHWLYHDPSSKRYQVLAVRIDDGQASATGEVPQNCLRRRRTIGADKDLLLVSTDGRHLGLLVADVLEISLWTLSEDSRTWGDRRVVVNRISMLQSVKLRFSLLACSANLDLEWFGEASGTVALKAPGTGIIVINLRTNEIAQFNLSGQRQHALDHGPLHCCPYEVDLVSLLARLRLRTF